MQLIPVILCGGAGSRLWPVSRALHPKPFIRLADGQSLLQKAFLRGAELPNVKTVLTVTNRDFFFKTEDEFREINATNIATSFILEPYGRNTAAAIAAAALQIAKTHGPDTLVLVLAADHLIADQEAFQKAVLASIELAATGKLSRSAFNQTLRKPATATLRPTETTCFASLKSLLEKKPRIPRIRPLPLEFRDVLLFRQQHAAGNGAALPRNPFRDQTLH